MAERESVVPPATDQQLHVEWRKGKARASAEGSRVLAIVANYNSAEEVDRFVTGWCKQRAAERSTLLVVDNSANLDGSPTVAMPEDNSLDCRILVPGGNLGYFGAADWAIERYQADRPLPDWIVVSNPDIELVGDGFIEQVLRLHNACPPTIVAPSIISVTDNVDENPFFARRPHATQMRFYKCVFRFRRSARVYEVGSQMKVRLIRATKVLGLVAAANRRRKLRVIYAPHGSLIIFHRSYFEAGCHFRHGAFLFGEEVFVAESVRRAGGTILYDPRITVMHRDRCATDTALNPRIIDYKRDAARYLADEFFASRLDRSK